MESSAPGTVSNKLIWTISQIICIFDIYGYDDLNPHYSTYSVGLTLTNNLGLQKLQTISINHITHSKLLLPLYSTEPTILQHFHAKLCFYVRHSELVMHQYVYLRLAVPIQRKPSRRLRSHFDKQPNWFPCPANSLPTAYSSLDLVL